MSTGPQLIPPVEKPDRNWLPILIAAGIVLGIVVVMLAVLGRGKRGEQTLPVNTPLDPYAANLPITNLVMSEASNLAGGKVTYVDGHIINKGDKTVTGITAQVLFRDVAHEVTQNETHSLRIIRTRDPYIDVEPVSAAPLKPGGERDFRLIFDSVSPDWDGAYPEIRIIHVDAK